MGKEAMTIDKMSNRCCADVSSGALMAACANMLQVGVNC